MDQPQNIIKEFQLSRLSIDEKSKPEMGLKVAKFINGTVQRGYSGYYFNRNTRYLTNRQAANGRINMQQFMDYLGFNGKFNYLNLNWESLKIVNRIISGWVGRSMLKKEKISVQAIDTLSVKQKDYEYEQVEFAVRYREILEQLQEASGVPMMPQDENMPQNLDELELFKQFQRLPEEILYEIGVNDILRANGCFDVLKEKFLHDSCEVGFVGTYTSMDSEGVIRVEYIQPENAIYSWSIYPDFRDTTWRGQIKSLKISELRRKYGKEFGGKLTEEELYEIATYSKDWQLNDKIRWSAEWTMAFMRPYDEWNVDVLDFEIRTVDSEKYTVTTTKLSNSTYVDKGLPKTKSGKLREKPLDNQKIIEDSYSNIYRGVYVRDSDKMLEWELKKNMIRPQDPKEIGNAEFSYSFYMYQPYMMRNIAIPEKIEVPVRQLILIDMRIQQIIATMKPPNTAINWNAVEAIDYGLGDSNKNVDFRKLYDQTGGFYYRDKDGEGNPLGLPFMEIQNAGFVAQMQSLIQLYQFQYQLIKDELGENPDLMNQAIQPRVTEGNVVASQQAADNATNYMYEAYRQLIIETAKKVSCLLQKSVLFGAKAYRKLLKEEDIDNRIFSTNIEMLPADAEIAMLDAKMNQAIASNPDLVMYLDTFKVIRIAKENVKLAESYYNNAMKKMLESKMQQAQQNAQMNAKAQQESVMAKGQMDMELKKLESEAKLEEIRLQGESQNKNVVISMASSLLSKGVTIPENVKPLIDTVIQNLMIPLAVENEQQQQAIIQQIQMDQQQQMMEAQEEGGMEQNMSEEELQQHEMNESQPIEMQEEQILQPQ